MKSIRIKKPKEVLEKFSTENNELNGVESIIDNIFKDLTIIMNKDFRSPKRTWKILLITAAKKASNMK